MAQAADRESASGGRELELIRFMLSGNHYALPVSDVDNIIETKPTTRVPRSADAIDGVMDHRGESAVVIELRELFDLPEVDAPELQKRIIILDDGVDNQTVGIRTDAVIGVEEYQSANLKQNLQNIELNTSVGGGRHDLLDGVVVLGEGGDQELLELIDIDAVLEEAREASRLDFQDE